MKKLLAALALSCLTTFAHAAEIKQGVTDKGTQYVIIEGVIEQGDAKKFYEIIQENRRIKVVVLNSNGGIVGDGMAIATLIHVEKLDTFILNNNVCFSICAPIFFSGAKKFIQKDATLGVHPAHEQGKQEKSAEANALIAWYFGSLGYDIGLVELWIEPNVQGMNYINAEINQKLNLGIIAID